MTAIKFLKLMPDDSIIVSSDQLTVMQIAMAKADNRFFIDEETLLGWAIVNPIPITPTN